MLGNLILLLLLLIMAFAGYKVYKCMWGGASGLVCTMMHAITRVFKIL